MERNYSKRLISAFCQACIMSYYAANSGAEEEGAVLMSSQSGFGKSHKALLPPHPATRCDTARPGPGGQLQAARCTGPWEPPWGGQNFSHNSPGPPHLCQVTGRNGRRAPRLPGRLPVSLLHGAVDGEESPGGKASSPSPKDWDTAWLAPRPLPAVTPCPAGARVRLLCSCGVRRLGGWCALGRGPPAVPRRPSGATPLPSRLAHQ